MPAKKGGKALLGGLWVAINDPRDLKKQPQAEYHHAYSVSTLVKSYAPFLRLRFG